MSLGLDKLIFAYYLPLTESLEKLFKLDYLSAHGVALEWWDLSAAYHAAGGAGVLERPYIRRLASVKEFERRLDEQPPRTGVVAVFPFEPRVLRLFRAVSRRGLPLICYVIGVLPAAEGGLGQRVRDNLDLLIRPRKLANFLARRGAFLCKRLGLVKDFDLAFTAGEVAGRDFAGSGRVVPINHVDYDDFLEKTGREPRLVEEPYAVFLDGNLAHHPDLALLGITKLISPERYYALLNAYFERLEKAHGVKIVVAAHPKADYTRNPFGGRRVFTGSTRVLTEHCRFAVTTMSTSLGYAVLYEKPLLFFTTDDIMDKYSPIKLDLFPSLFARALGRECVNLDRAERPEALAVAAPDKLRYEDYKYKYLVSRRSEGTMSRDIVLEVLSNAAGHPAKVDS
jgi:hypothetical protein